MSGPLPSAWPPSVAARILHWRRAIVTVAVLLTLVLAAGIPRLTLEVAFDKTLPNDHPFMAVYAQYGPQFGHRDEVLVALVAKQGDIYTPAFLTRLEQLTNAVFFLPGVDRARVLSLFTPNVRFTEVVAGGFTGGTVLPDGFAPSPSMVAQLRTNVRKSEQARLLVSADGSAALVRAGLLPLDPATGKALDYLQVAEALERNIREPYSDAHFEVHILGFAPLMGEMSAALHEVAGFLGLTLLAMLAILYAVLRSMYTAFLPVACSSAAIVWLFGLLGWLGVGVNPVGILVPFLVLAIGVSHGVQMAGAWRHANPGAVGSPAAARTALDRLLLPGVLALLIDALGFATIGLIDIPLVRELGLIATAGVGLLLVCNLFLLPSLLAALPVPRAAGFAALAPHVAGWLQGSNGSAGGRARAWAMVGAAGLIAASAVPLAARVNVGDVQRGAPELHAASTYNQSLTQVSQLFSAGIDTLVVYAEVGADGCMNFAAMQALDDVVAALRMLPQVLSVRSLTDVAKTNSAGYHEGSLKWRVLPREGIALAELIAPVQTSTGLLNHDCSVLPVYVDTTDHRAATIGAVVQQIEALRAALPAANALQLRLAGGNLGALAATNDVVAAAQFPVLATIYSVVFLLCLLGFRSPQAAVCIVLPLAMVSVLCYALMYALDIGLTPYTLPVVAVGAGIGVDYSLYLYAQYRPGLRSAGASPAVIAAAVRQSSGAIVATCLTLTAAVLPWLLSGLKYQADMGLLLTFMFIVNMLAATVVMPALLALMTRRY